MQLELYLGIFSLLRSPKCSKLWYCFIPPLSEFKTAHYSHFGIKRCEYKFSFCSPLCKHAPSLHTSMWTLFSLHTPFATVYPVITIIIIQALECSNFVLYVRKCVCVGKLHFMKIAVIWYSEDKRMFRKPKSTFTLSCSNTPSPCYKHNIPPVISHHCADIMDTWLSITCPQTQNNLLNPLHSIYSFTMLPVTMKAYHFLSHSLSLVLAKALANLRKSRYKMIAQNMGDIVLSECGKSCNICFMNYPLVTSRHPKKLILRR